MIKRRINPTGLEFELSNYANKVYGHQTRVQLNSGPTVKHVIMDMNIEEMSQCWYDWMVKGQNIQTAFAKLPAEHREFILSGITPEEWDEMFKDGEEE